MATNSRRTPQQWAEIVASFHASGMTQHAFCSQHGIGSTTLDKWKRRLADTVPGRTSSKSFISLHPVSDANNSTVTVHAGNGVRVDCPLSMGIDTIAALTRAMASEG